MIMTKSIFQSMELALIVKMNPFCKFHLHIRAAGQPAKKQQKEEADEFVPLEGDEDEPLLIDPRYRDSIYEMSRIASRSQ